MQLYNFIIEKRFHLIFISAIYFEICSLFQDKQANTKTEFKQIIGMCGINT